MKLNIFWFRRDLRLTDNSALEAALETGLPVLPLFIFDTSITDELPGDDPRIGFIYDALMSINAELGRYSSSLVIRKGDPVKIWPDIAGLFEIDSVFVSRDYEPYGIKRDESVGKILASAGISLKSFKDQVIFEQKEIVKPDNTPYTVFTPYKKRWLLQFKREFNYAGSPAEIRRNFYRKIFPFPSLSKLGFRKSTIEVRPFDLSVIRDYDRLRDIPSADATSYLGPHLRFGTISIRSVVKKASEENNIFLGELIWREFFMQILFNFPHVVTENFRKKYDGIRWRNNEREFQRWCDGETGYPIVDAGMRQLSETGYMHNRVRMITAGFLCKHLLTDWRWGEAWFAQKLLDFELSSNNGNWQWSAGTGCDAAPYFRIFNPLVQQQKFDPCLEYTIKWLPDVNRPGYPEMVVEHSYARKRAIETYKERIML